MGKYQPLIWAIIGGVTLAVVNVAFSWYVGGAEWTDSALFPIPFLLIIGGAIGATAGTLRRRRLLRRELLRRQQGEEF